MPSAGRSASLWIQGLFLVTVVSADILSEFMSREGYDILTVI